MKPLAYRLALSLIAVFPCVAHAEGELDTSYGFGSGKVRVAIDQGSTAAGKADHLLDIVVQPDGRQLLFGSSANDTFVGVGLARLNVNGTADSTFNGDGNGDGEIVFGAFGGDLPRAIALLPDGRIVVSQRLGNDSVLWRRASNGDADAFPGSSFNVLPVTLPGASGVDLSALHPLSDGRFLGAGTIAGIGAGTDFFVARFDANGAPEPAFGTSPGYTRINFALDGASVDTLRAIAVAPDGRIAALGEVSSGDREFGVAMLDANGDPIATFDGEGRATVDFDIGLASDDRARAACFDPAGRLFVGGTVTDQVNTNGIGMALLTTLGALQGTFDGDGKRVVSVFAPTFLGDVHCTSDGRFLVAGTIATSSPEIGPREAFVTRFLADGGNDNTFGTGFNITAVGFNSGSPTGGRDDEGRALALDRDGRIYVGVDAQFSGADYDFGIARLRGNVLFSDGFE